MYLLFTGLITVRNPDPIDYETDQHMRLLVAATSNGVYAYTTVWVSLTDINDNPPRFTQDHYVTKVYEEQDKYTYVMQVSESLPDHQFLLQVFKELAWHSGFLLLALLSKVVEWLLNFTSVLGKT